MKSCGMKFVFYWCMLLSITIVPIRASGYSALPEDFVDVDEVLNAMYAYASQSTHSPCQPLLVSDQVDSADLQSPLASPVRRSPRSRARRRTNSVNQMRAAARADSVVSDKQNDAAERVIPLVAQTDGDREKMKALLENALKDCNLRIKEAVVAILCNTSVTGPVKKQKFRNCVDQKSLSVLHIRNTIGDRSKVALLPSYFEKFVYPLLEASYRDSKNLFSDFDNKRNILNCLASGGHDVLYHDFFGRLSFQDMDRIITYGSSSKRK